MRLVFHYWKWKALPSSEKKLAAIARVSISDWHEIKASLQPFFDSEWRSGKLEREIVDAENRHAKACRLNAQRWGNLSATDSATDSAAESFTYSKPQPQPQPESQPDFGHSNSEPSGYWYSARAKSNGAVHATVDDDDDVHPLDREIPF